MKVKNVAFHIKYVRSLAFVGLKLFSLKPKTIKMTLAKTERKTTFE